MSSSLRQFFFVILLTLDSNCYLLDETQDIGPLITSFGEVITKRCLLHITIEV